MLPADTHRRLVPACAICGALDDIAERPFMGACIGNVPARPLICRECYSAWYEGAGTTVEAIRTYRGITLAS